MPVTPTGDILSLVLFAILVVCVIGLVAYVWIRLGRRRKLVLHRGIGLHLNPALPTGKVVFIDAASHPIGETAFEKFDTVVLPPACAGALLSPADYAALLAQKTPVKKVPENRRAQA